MDIEKPQRLCGIIEHGNKHENDFIFAGSFDSKEGRSILSCCTQHTCYICMVCQTAQWELIPQCCAYEEFAKGADFKLCLNQTANGSFNTVDT